MSIYRYTKNSVIDEVTFEKSDGGSSRAYLHARNGTDEQTFANISLSMAKHGWQVVPHTKAGKPVLEVRGFNRNQQVNSVLFENKWAHGPAEIESEKRDSKKFTDVVKKRSLFLSGLAFVISDLSFIGYGIKDSSPLNTAAGLSYAAGTASSLAFARKDTPDLQIKEIANKMAAYIREQNFQLPDDCSLRSITEDKHKGFIKSADDYFRRYPAEMMNTCFGVAGACIAAAALKNGVFGKAGAEAIKEMITKKGGSITPEMASKEVEKHMKHSGWKDVGLGVTTMASAAFGNLVEEKVHDPDMPRKRGLEGKWEWMQENPLAVTGMGYLASTLFHAYSTAYDWKHADSEKKKALPLRATFVAMTFLGEVLVAISSKGHGKGVVSDKSVDKSIISLTADLIAKQPANMQNHLIDYMAGFLGREDVLAMKDTKVKDMLTHQVELMKNNPWAKCMELIPDTGKNVKEKSPAEKGTSTTSWQSAVKFSHPELQSPSFI